MLSVTDDRQVVTLDRLLPINARRFAEGEALVGFDQRLTWADYDRQTSTVARFLVDQGVVKGDRVAVSLPKGVPAFIAVHGIIRAGAIVVPIDPFAGASLGRTALADAAVTAFIGSPETSKKFDPSTIESLALSVAVIVDPHTQAPDTDGPDTDTSGTPWSEALNHDSTTILPTMSPDDPAYIIYTSGSTGRPKGMLHTHASAMAYATRAAKGRELTPQDRVGGMSAFHFDMSTLELYAAPFAAAAVVIMSEAHLRMPASLVSRTANERVTLWYTVPALLNQVTSRGGLENHDLTNLRLICFAGEPFAARALNETMAAFPSATFANIYGPAEVNECTNHTVTDRVVGVMGAPIGRTWQGADHVIVHDGQPVAVGQPGELLISAPTAMRGYWNRPDLDDAAFVEREGSAHRWYRTGDIVIEDETGVLWFRGRRDHQIKIRGARVELESIESVLADAPGVVHAVAGPDRAGSDADFVIAAVVFGPDSVASETDIRRWCAARLPPAAVPRSVRVLASVPMTATGKVDRRTVRTQLLTTSSPVPSKPAGPSEHQE